MTRCLTIAAALSFGCAAPLAAATLTQTLDAVLADLAAATGTPGAAATVRRNGAVVWSGATGYADPASGRSFTPDTLSSIASVTKLVTATMMQRLEERGLLDLDDPIATYIPADLPGAGAVTARQLIDMTAGYADVEFLPQFQAAFDDPNHAWTRAELLAEVEAPQFPPGSQYEYSNTNYLILAEIVDRVYPGGMAQAFQDDIVVPAGLEGLMYFDRDASAAPRVAHGFRTRGGVTIDVNAGALDLGVNTGVWGTIWGDGGIVATADGVALFADALYGGTILNDANTAALDTCSYTIADRCWGGFIGAFNGYSAFVMHDPTRGVTISAVTNALDEDSFAQAAFLDGLIGAYIKSEGAPAPVPLPGAAAFSLVGLAVLAGLSRRRVRND
jgi:D-alanyl-D-alanine carboxypeptidase